MTAKRKRSLSGSGGFTLIELSIVLVIIALVAGAALTAGTSRVKSAKINQTQMKLDRIEEALGAYLALNGRLPCPADGSLATTDANFGRELRSGGACDASLTPASGPAISVGVVPAISLNLPDEFLFDGWGRRITYAVHQDYARDKPTFSAPPTTPPLITIDDASGNERTNAAIVVLVSHGENGEGAWTREGGGSRFNPSGVALTGPELENAHDPSSFGSFNATFVQSSQTASFDDQVRYKLKWQMVRLAGGVVDTSMCNLARLTLLAANPAASPKTGPVGCDTDGAGVTKIINSECMIRQQQLATQIADLCFN